MDIVSDSDCHPMRRLSPLIPVILLALGVLAPESAHAQARSLFGTRDFEMDWQVSPEMRQFRLRYLAASRLLRIEMLDGSGVAVIKDLAKGDIQVLVGEGTKGRYAATGPIMGAFNGAPRERTREVAGQACRDFDLGAAIMCLSDEGIPLVIESETQTITTLRLLKQAQSPALFVPPKDAKSQPLPGGIGNALPKLPF